MTWLNEMYEIIYKDTEDSELFTEGNKAGMKYHTYGAVSTQEVVDHQTHMNDEEKLKLKELIDQNTALFDSKLGLYPKTKFHIKLKENMETPWQRPFPIPYWHDKVFSAEVDEMIKD